MLKREAFLAGLRLNAYSAFAETRKVGFAGYVQQGRRDLHLRLWGLGSDGWHRGLVMRSSALSMAMHGVIRGAMDGTVDGACGSRVLHNFGQTRG
jgi:hypothetical protein